MGRKSREKQERKKGSTDYARKSGVVVIPPSEPPKKNAWNKKGWSIALIIFAILAALGDSVGLYDRFKSTHTKDQEANTDQGDIIAPVFNPGPFTDNDYSLEISSIFTKARIDTFPKVNGIRLVDRGSHEFCFVVGQSMWRVQRSMLERGITFLNPKAGSDCYDSKIKLILKDGRLYASAEFRDLKDGLLVGKMNYNHWEVYLQNKLKYTPNDTTLEVIDRQGYVIFSLAFRDERQGPNGGVVLRGYFQNPKSVLILNNAKKLRAQIQGVPDPRSPICIKKIDNPNWKQQAEEHIDKIKSIFDSLDDL